MYINIYIYIYIYICIYVYMYICIYVFSWVMSWYEKSLDCYVDWIEESGASCLSLSVPRGTRFAYIDLNILWSHHS